jgi:hypothetical protein
MVKSLPVSETVFCLSAPDKNKSCDVISRLNGYKDGTAMKVQPYESETFVSEMEETWKGLKPLYEQLHAYVRSKLLMK